MTQHSITDLAAAAKRSELLEGRLIDREQHVATLQNELEAAEDTIAALRDRLDTVTDPSTTAAPVSESNASLEQWVDNEFAHLVEIRTGAATRWCLRWSEHPEAVLRLTAIREDYDNCLGNPQLGISGWLRTSVDHHLPRLTDGQGPFSGCTTTDHEPPPVLPASITQPPTADQAQPPRVQTVTGSVSPSESNGERQT